MVTLPETTTLTPASAKRFAATAPVRPAPMIKTSGRERGVGPASIGSESVLAAMNRPEFSCYQQPGSCIGDLIE